MMAVDSHRARRSTLRSTMIRSLSKEVSPGPGALSPPGPAVAMVGVVMILILALSPVLGAAVQPQPGGVELVVAAAPQDTEERQCPGDRCVRRGRLRLVVVGRDRSEDDPSAL